MTGLLSLLVGTAFAQPSSLVTPAARAACFNFFSSSATTPPPAGSGWTCIEVYISSLTYVVIQFVGAVSLIMLMINGFRYMTGPAIPGGSSDGAKKGIQMALVGLAVSLLTYIILDTFIMSVTGS